MLAYRLVDWQKPQLVDMPAPEASIGNVVIRIGGAGLCGTDVKLIAAPPGSTPFIPPYTLGHEIAGWVHEVGPGVSTLRPGDAVAVSAGAFCGRCALCASGHTNYCAAAQSGRGFGQDGGLAEFISVPERHAVPIGDLAPEDAAPLTDAAVTAYHAVRQVYPKLGPESTTVVIGTGGLGGYGVQFLRLLCPTTVVAIDTSPMRLEFASALGAHVTLPADDTNVASIRDLTGGQGADAVLDFVGTESAVRTAMASVRPLGSIRLVGGAGGSVPFGHSTLPAHGVDIVSPVGSTLRDLIDVLALARAGRLRIESERYSLADVEQAYDALRDGRLLSRAVVVP